jgi:hypothetical protein
MATTEARSEAISKRRSQMKRQFTLIVMAGMFLLAACQPASTPTSAPPSNTAQPPTAAPNATPLPPSDTPIPPTPTELALGPGQCIELVQNGDFEAGKAAPWVESSNLNKPLVMEFPGRGGGKYGALLGSAPNADESLYQTVAIPAEAASVMLAYSWNPASHERDQQPHDWLYVTLQDESGNVLEKLDNINNTTGKNFESAQVTHDLTAHAGQTVRLHFHVTTDAQNDSDFLLDGVSVQACGPAASTATPLSARFAQLSELINEVQARASEVDTFATASEGEAFGAGGQARTGEESKVRIDLTEGTIIRLAPQSEFTLTELNEDMQNPFTRLKLAAGKLWVILTGGELGVDTEMGTVTVRGSYMSVDYYPAYSLLIVTCLEGDCELRNSFGATLLTTGQAASVNGESQPPSAARPMSASEYQAWTNENPEAVPVAPTLTPTPQGATPGPSLPPPSGTAPQEPIHYLVTSNCGAHPPTNTPLPYHVRFEGPVTIEVVAPPGETVDGFLPAGLYLVTQWEEGEPPRIIDVRGGGEEMEGLRCVGP